MRSRSWLFLLFLFGPRFAQIASYFSYPVGDENGKGWLHMLAVGVALRLVKELERILKPNAFLFSAWWYITAWRLKKDCFMP